MQTNWKSLTLVSLLALSLGPTFAFGQPQARPVLGEQVEGCPASSTSESWLLSPEELAPPSLPASAGASAPAGAPPFAIYADPECGSEGAGLPPIIVSLETGYYEQVPTVVRTLRPLPPPPPEANLPGIRRRRQLSSRGAQAAPSQPQQEVVESTVYRSVYRRGWKKVDIAPIIHKYANQYHLDPWLLRGIIEVESAFRPYATSCVGAGGLMQLMPSTASYLGCRDRFDPEQNIAAGARYLRQMLNRFDQDYDLAIAAYNAGPGNVEHYGGIPPFAETQNYVRKVRRAWGKKATSS